MKSQVSENFLSMAIKHRYSANDENRLSQIIAAGLKFSPPFRKIFCHAYKIPDEIWYGDIDVIREHEKMDICFLRGDETICVIENKLFTRPSDGQLSRYARRAGKSAHKLLISQMNQFKSDIQQGWDYGKWSVLLDQLSLAKGDFVCEQILGYLKSIGIPGNLYLKEEEIEKLIIPWLKSTDPQKEFSVQDGHDGLPEIGFVRILEEIFDCVVKMGSHFNINFSSGHVSIKKSYWYNDKKKKNKMSQIEASVGLDQNRHKEASRCCLGLQFDQDKFWFDIYVLGPGEFGKSTMHVNSTEFEHRDLELDETPTYLLECWQQELLRLKKNKRSA